MGALVDERAAEGGLAELASSQPRPKRKPASITKVCDICGASFLTHYPKAKRCSFDCQEHWRVAHSHRRRSK